MKIDPDDVWTSISHGAASIVMTIIPNTRPSMSTVSSGDVTTDLGPSNWLPGGPSDDVVKRAKYPRSFYLL